MAWYQSLTTKRVFDLVVSVLGLLLMAVPMCVVAGLIYLQLGLPVIFTQKRAGKNGTTFTLYKFRTMTSERDSSGKLLPDKERLTSFGQFLRRTTIDELPELFNILKGDMSFVGPRPLSIDYTDRYTEFQSRRLEMKPGLTGLAVIKGRNSLTWDERFKYDVWYIDNWTMSLDLRILRQTLIVVYRRTGISHNNHPTMPKFTRDNKNDDD
jgi:lipopolysaccharide/colanic/teichoic acid biosynthesis glycosyltransferase